MVELFREFKSKFLQYKQSDLTELMETWMTDNGWQVQRADRRHGQPSCLRLELTGKDLNQWVLEHI